MILVTSALVLGFLHGLGADHLMAIVALSTGAATESPSVRRIRPLTIAVRFAAGHALLLGLGAGTLLAVGWSLPLVVERGGELLGGILLVVLGVVGLYGVVAGRVYGHSHRHGHEPAAHWHLHVGRRDHHPPVTAHSHVPTIVGAAFAISSLRALALLAPFGGEAGAIPIAGLLALIAIFALGIVLSMSLFGIALGRVLTIHSVARLGRSAATAMAVTSVALGVYWIVKL